jgi:hypothetical protein
VGSLKRVSAVIALAACVVFVAGAAADENQTLSITGVTVSEGAGTATFQVSLSAGADPDATVDYTTANGSAVAGSDYTTTAGNLTVPAGGTADIVVPISDDGVHENAETFTVELSNPVRATLGNTSASGTINDDDAAPSVSISGPATVNENAGTAVYNVAISGASGASASVNYSASGGTATAGTDFSLTPGTLTWTAGDTATKQITVNITNDTLDEDDETFSVNLAGANGVTIGTGTANSTILDNDNAPTTGAFANVSTAEGQSGTHNLTFTVSISAVSGKPVTVNYSTVNGTATAGSDFVAQVNQNVVIPAGSTSAPINIVINGDTVPEPDEAFTVNLNSATNATLGADTQATGTITNDDSGVTASINDVTAAEGNSGTSPATTFTFTVSLSAPAPSAGSITWRTTDSSAIAPGDYAAQNVTTPIAQGASSFQIQIAVVGDTVPEPNETFFVDLISATGPIGISADNRGTGTINNDDNTPVASINDVSVTEGNAPATVNATFTVTLSAAAPAQVQLRYSTVNNSATAGSDYVGVANAVLTIPQGATTGTFSIVVNGDAVPEGSGTPPAETFFVDLVGVVSGPVTIGSDSRGIGSIVDDDNPVSASINDVATTEGHSGTTNATFTVTLSGPAAAQVQIRYSTANGTAIAPGDYNPVSNAILTIAQGQTSGTFNIEVKGDTLPEGSGTPPAETYFVDLVAVVSGPATISADSRGNGSIVDDDSPVIASISDSSVAEGHSGGANMSFTVNLSGPAQAPLQIRYSTVNGTADGTDYFGVSNAIVAIPQGATSGTFTIVVKGDTIPEGTGTPPAETFFVDLVSVASGPVTIGPDSRGQGLILDDDTPVTVSIADATTNEGDVGDPILTFTVTLSGAAPAPVTVNYSTSNGSATAPDDYTAVTNGVLNLAQGATTATFDITLHADKLTEGNENFLIVITASGAQPGKMSAVGTIIDDDAPPPPPPGSGPGTSSAGFPTMTITDASTTEGSPATFTVSLSATSTRTISVNFATTDGTATAGADYIARTGSLSFAPGETSQTIVITTLGDGVAEGDETFSVVLSSVSFANLGKGSGAGTIRNGARVAGPPPTTTPDDVLPKMVLGPRTPTVVLKGYAIMSVSCLASSPIACSGTVNLETTTKPTIKLATKKFTVKKGRTAKIHVFLSKRALTMLKKSKAGTLKARAVVFVKSSKKKNVRVVPGVVTLKGTAALLRPKTTTKTTAKTTTKKTTPKKTTPKKQPEEPLPPIKVEVEP